MILLTETVDLLKQMKVWERDVGKENEQEEKSGGKKVIFHMFFHAKNFYKFLRYVRYHHFESFSGNVAGWKGCRERGLFSPVW